MATEFDDLSDEELMEHIIEHNRAAFAILVKRHTKRFYAVAYRTLFNQNDAEDVIQESFIKLWNKPDLWDAGKHAKFTTWFYRIIVNACLDVNKKKHPQNMPEHAIIADKGNSAESIIKEQQHKAVEAALKKLPERQRIAINLCFYEDLSNKDAAAALGIGKKALESLLMRAKKELKLILNVEG